MTYFFLLIINQLTWYKDGEILPASTRYTTDYDLNTLVAYLKIEDARLTDIGKYLVVAENKVGQDQTSAETFVLDTANIDDRPLINPDAFKDLEKVPTFEPIEYVEDASKGKPPKFIIHLPSELKLFDGEKIRMKCKIEGYPFPKVNYSY